MFAAGYHDSLVCNPLAGKVGNLSQLQYLDGNAVSLLSPSEDIFYHPSLSEDILLRPHSNTNNTQIEVVYRCYMFSTWVS